MIDSALPRDFQKGTRPCVSHHHACDCREAELAAEISRLKARVNAMREILSVPSVQQFAHDMRCEHPCTCGLDELIGEAEE